jgi:hypothetical protein
MFARMEKFLAPAIRRRATWRLCLPLLFFGGSRRPSSLERRHPRAQNLGPHRRCRTKERRPVHAFTGSWRFTVGDIPKKATRRLGSMAEDSHASNP